MGSIYVKVEVICCYLKESVLQTVPLSTKET